jgi:hypothetical protein
MRLRTASGDQLPLYYELCAAHYYVSFLQLILSISIIFKVKSLFIGIYTTS